MSAIRGQITKLILFGLFAIINCQNKLTTTTTTTKPRSSQGNVTIGPVAISTTTEDEQVLKRENGEKAVDEPGPNLVKTGNDTLDSLNPTGNHSNGIVNKIVDKVVDVNIHVVNLTLSGVERLSTDLHSLKHNTVADVKHHVIDILNSTRKLTSDPLSVATAVGRAVGNLTMGTLDRATFFRKYG